ncbi:uncharacterized protein C8Q71DRAFT_797080 [Rhodofomes roseus]|uniref:Endoplasmic reticulum junction formation protein lunapark n=1 Tax=Rhodofomes roseus TaxID=34475 RepID=A0ABQ8KEZ3_9APHY|nr:uncharacterized protein C8Q71DRAFT_797080 [Rhodofomes roseus]KAH9836290.1 hypothetical protein C8Q71DRAFT_797080 [Rhodofomes roseus]
MGLFSRWFSKSQPEDYEQILASLANDIAKRQQHLSEIRLRERRSTLVFSVWALAFWGLWAGLWYADYLPNVSTMIPGVSGHSRESAWEKTAKSMPVFMGPIVILFMRRIVQIWYTRAGDAEEKALIALRKKQREKIEEVKNKTNYYSTRNLIERYDDGPRPVTPGTPQRPQIPQQQQRLPQTPARPAQQLNPQTPAPAPMSPSLQQQLSPSPLRPMPPPRKQWFDKLADAILGDDDGTGVGAAASRYALICQKCFAHNGLVKESMWEDAQYVCPKCGHFNPSARAMREARSKSGSPDSRPPTAPPNTVTPARPQQRYGQPIMPMPAGPNGAASSGANFAGNGAVRQRPRGDDAAVVDEASVSMDVDS